LLAVTSSCIRGRGDRKAHLSSQAIIEFIHTATLLHDDVVDISTLRRGRPTVNSEFGNAPSVLVGDFLYTRAFQLMVQLDDMRVLKLMADVTNLIAEGEVMQLVRAGDPDTTREQYFDVITRKTAILFAAACEGRGDAEWRERRNLSANARYWSKPWHCFPVNRRRTRLRGRP
jgi:octaprenyl-diphosphate synthase